MKTLKEYIYEAKQPKQWELANDMIPNDIRKALQSSKSKDDWNKAWFELKEWLDANATSVNATEADYKSDPKKYYILLTAGTGGSKDYNGRRTIRYKSTLNDETYVMTWNSRGQIGQAHDGSNDFDGITGQLRYLDHNASIRNITDGYLYEL